MARRWHPMLSPSQMRTKMTPKSGSCCHCLTCSTMATQVQCVLWMSTASAPRKLVQMLWQICTCLPSHVIVVWSEEGGSTHTCPIGNFAQFTTLKVTRNSAPGITAARQCKSILPIADECRPSLLQRCGEKQVCSHVTVCHPTAGKANMGIMRDEEGAYIAYALRPIKKGEEVSCPHQASSFSRQTLHAGSKPR